MRVLLDTDICSAYVRGHPAVGSRCAQFAGALCVSTLTVGEILVWVLRSRDPIRAREGVQQLLDFVSILDVTVEIAEQFAVLRAQLLNVGRPRPAVDLFIAATAITHNLQLITHNSRDYDPIPGLRHDDWCAP